MGRRRLVNVQAEKFALGSEDNAGGLKIAKRCERSSGAASGRAPGGLTWQELGGTRPPPTPPLQEDLRGSHGSTWPRVLNPVQRGRKLSSRRAVDVCSALTSARVWQVSRFCAGSAPNATRPDTYNSQMAVQIRDKEKRAAEQGGERWVTR